MARPQPGKTKDADPRTIAPIWIAVALMLLTYALYARVGGHQFINYDDHLYVTENRIVQQGLTWKGVAWAFTTNAASNWHPLTWLSHMLDCELFVEDDGSQWAGGHHRVNVVLHALNSGLVLLLLHRMTRALWRSALVAALFALHPLHVESVAWVAERKDVLSTFFGLLALHAYLRFVERRSWARYSMLALWFALSLLAKPMLVTLPCLLLLLDYWPLKRGSIENWRQNSLPLLLEKAPLLVLSAASSAATMWAQSAGGSVIGLERLPLGMRILNATVVYAEYLFRTIWPAKLALFYPHPGQWPAWRIAVSALVLLLISALAVMTRRARPHLLVGWLWYLGTLVPVVGLVQVGSQSMADRYTYVPLIGIFIMLAWSLPPAIRRSQRAQSFTIAAACAVLALLALITWRQIGFWRDSITVFTRTVAMTERNFTAHHNLGQAYEQQLTPDLARAQYHYEQALAINPRYLLALNNYGNLLAQQGQTEQAVTHFQRAIEVNPAFAKTYVNLGAAYADAGRREEAIAAFQRALSVDPGMAEAHFNLGLIYAGLNNFPQSIEFFQRAVELNPQLAEAHAHLGASLLALRRANEAVDACTRALELNANLHDAHVTLGKALASQQRFDEAIAHFREALRQKPDHPEAARFLEIALQQSGRRP